MANLPREDPRPGRVPHRPVELAPNASAQITSFATANGIIRSMAYTGACWDNVMAESFFATLKTEFYHRRVWPIRKRAKLEVGAWIEDRPVEMAKLVRSRQSRQPIHPASTPSTIRFRAFIPGIAASTSDHFADARISRHVSIQRGPTTKQLLSERARFVF